MESFGPPEPDKAPGMAVPDAFAGERVRSDRLKSILAVSGRRHLLAGLSLDQGRIATEFHSHFQEFLANAGVGNAIRHATGAVCLKTIMVNFEHSFPRFSGCNSAAADLLEPKQAVGAVQRGEKCHHDRTSLFDHTAG